MRTSLNEIKEAEDYLLDKLSPQDALLFEARLILNPLLSENVEWQKKTYTIITSYSRNEIKKEASAVFDKLFNDPGKTGFRNKILSIFHNP